MQDDNDQDNKFNTGQLKKKNLFVPEKKSMSGKTNERGKTCLAGRGARTVKHVIINDKMGFCPQLSLMGIQTSTSVAKITN